MQYIQVENFGLGFITHADRESFDIQGYPGNIWATDDSQAATDWAVRVGGTIKTKEEAQAAVDAAILSAPQPMPIVYINPQSQKVQLILP